MNDRILLAEWQGWKQHFNGWWSTPRIKGCATHGLENPPDPFKDANDCNALIRHLNALGYMVRVETGFGTKQGDFVVMWLKGQESSAPLWQGNNWMHGVCELALKIIKEACVKSLGEA